MHLRLLIVGLFSASAAAAGEYGPDDVDWTGVFLGVHAGAATGEGTATLYDYAGALATLDVANGIFPQVMEERSWAAAGGIHAGFNWQSGNIVTGFEGDIGYAGFKAEHELDALDTDVTSPYFGVTTSTTYRTTFGALATARLRGGYAIDRTLVYATGGIAVGQVENAFTMAIPALSYSSPGWSDDGIKAGYVIGGGVEHRLTDRIGLRLELMHVDLADTIINATDPVAFPGESISYRFDNQLLIAYGGVNWYF